MRGILAYFRSMGFSSYRPAVYSWFFNMLFTIFIYYGYYKVFSIPAGSARIGDEAAAGAAIGVFTFLTEILQHYKGSLPLVFSLTFLYTVGFQLASIYVSGGVYAVFVEEEKTSFTNLIASSTHNFYSMLKIALVNLLSFIAALIVPGLLLILFFNMKSLSSNETVIGVFAWIWVMITILFLAFAAAVYDFTRIYRLKEDRGIWYSFKQGLIFTFTNKLNFLSVYAIYAVSLVILYLAYAVMMSLVQHLLFVFLLFWMHQGFMMVRYYLKIVVIRAEIRLVD